MKQELDPRYKEVLAKVEKYCLDHEDPLIVSKYARYFREGYDAFGLEEEQIHALRDEILAAYSFSALETAELGWYLLQPGKYEYASVAVLLLKEKKDEFDRDVFDWVQKWFDKGVDNWAHSDMLCSQITPVFLDKEIVRMEDFVPWRDSTSRWTRRAVPVTLLALRKTAEPEALLEFIEPMMLDDARVVHQGLGWFLRELWKLHHEQVEDFLGKYKDTCARLIIQYATEKMKEDKKERFRRTKAPKQAKPLPKKPVPPKKTKHVPTMTPPKKKKFKPNRADS